MASTTIVLKEPTATTKTLIYLLFRLNNQRLKYSTGQKIHPKLWNADKQRAKETRQNPNAAELNMLLGNHENAAMDIYRRIINDGETPTLSAIKKGLDETFDVPVVNKASLGFFGFIEEYINTTNKKAGTIKTYKQAQRILTEYQTFSRIPITFESIDLDFHQSFIKFLTQKGYYANTISNYIKILKVFMNEALDRSLTANVAFKSKRFKRTNEESESIYLTTKEVSELCKLDLDEPRLKCVRDLFIIGCYTGLRFSDLAALDKNSIIENGTRLKILTEKTGELVVIPIHPEVKKIIDRNEGIPRVISNQKMNEYLKEIGEKAGIDEATTLHSTQGGKRVKECSPKYKLITAHTARRSFATNAYLSNVPTISIMKITGHRTEKAFLLYIKISQEDNANKLLEHPFFN